MNDNPKWQPFLDKLPESLHPIIKPVLADWDKGIQEHINSIHETYKPYKEFADRKVSPEHIEQGLDILGQVTQDPAAFVKRVDEVYNLNLTNPPPQVPDTQVNTGYEDGDFDMAQDITKHPLFQEFAKKLDEVQGTLQSRTQKEQEEQEIKEFEQYLDTLNEKYKDQGGINRELVTAYMSQGLDGDQAVTAYQEQLTAMLSAQTALNLNQSSNGQDQVSDNPPAVMGSSGTPGSGLPDSDVKPSEWSNSQTNDVVAEMLRAAADSQP